jgi:hypothetical protein
MSSDAWWEIKPVRLAASYHHATSLANCEVHNLNCNVTLKEKGRGCWSCARLLCENTSYLKSYETWSSRGLSRIFATFDASGSKVLFGRSRVSGNKSDEGKRVIWYGQVRYANMALACRKLPHSVQETTAVHQIFGGYLRSQVRCLKCKAESNTYDPCLDLSVDINTSTNLQKALKDFIKVDHIGGRDNKYKCSA